MNDRQKAMEILKQAREALLARLAERVLEGREEILDDAAGYCYSSAIESLHDQIGQRLGNVTALLAHLQSSDDPDHYDPAPDEATTVVPQIDTSSFGAALDKYCEEHMVDGWDPLADEIALADDALDDDALAPPHPAGDATAFAEEAEVSEMPPPRSTEAPRPAAKRHPRGRKTAVRGDAESASAPPADAGCRDRVFQETDFRSIDLLAADLDCGVLKSADAGADDAPAAE